MGRRVYDLRPLFVLLGLFSLSYGQANTTCISNGGSVYGFTVQGITGNNVSLSQYKGMVSLVVNVASF